MMFPSMSVVMLGAVLLALLVAVDWYVWGATFASDLRLPTRSTQAKGTIVAAQEREHENAGFKHVA